MSLENFEKITSSPFQKLESPNIISSDEASQNKAKLAYLEKNQNFEVLPTLAKS